MNPSFPHVSATARAHPNPGVPPYVSGVHEVRLVLGK